MNMLWRRLRAEVLKEQHNECQLCKDNGLVEIAVTVHHIKYVKHYPELALTKDNLMAVCKECHYKIHHNLIVKKQLNEEKW
ncbi:HNH endonuclease [Clostridium sp.]|uniref:HNH endonuclease n=1 Tax=Clostridium sp. TaxID=1506 RepID=UPI00262352E4|nr:HNH endonuclease [Clostridium sp.]